MKQQNSTGIRGALGVLILLAVANSCLAQAPACTQEILLGRIGSWKQHPDYIWPGKNYTPAMQPEIFKREEAARDILKAAYPRPKGMEVFWKHQILGTPLYKSGTVVYDLWCQLFEYLCDSQTGQPVLEDESSNSIHVIFNQFGNLINYDTSLRIGHLYLALMPPRVGKIGETDLFQTNLVRADERFVIISRPGELPYLPLNRGQYLQALKDKLIREEKKLTEGALKYAKSGADSNRAIQYWQKEYDPKIKSIDGYLASAGSQDLALPALVRDMQSFQKFYSESEGGRMPFILNLDYFKKPEPPYFPRFIVLDWAWNDGEGPTGGLLRPVPPDMDKCCRVAKFYKESMEKNVDIQALRNLLDK
jgi:hypothetical protein